MGSTAPSRAGLRNLLPCHPVASAPVSASPSPTTQATIRSGVANAAPKAWRRAEAEQVGVVERGAEGVAQGVAELAPLVDRAGGFGGDVAGDAAGEAELLEQ